MKTLKFTLAFIIVAFFTCGSISGQTWHVDVAVTFDEYDFAPYSPVLGIVSGSYTYSLTIKFSEAGSLESLHWVLKGGHLQNKNGDKIILIDTGHDNLGLGWDFWSNPSLYNDYNPDMIWGVEDGWLDDYIPDSMPIEGTMVGMSFKMMIRGQKYDVFAGMVQLHRNARGEITAEVSKP